MATTSEINERMQIGQKQYVAAFKTAEEVVYGALTITDAIERLKKSGMHASSARNYLYSIRNILLGQRYTRTIKRDAWFYFISEIERNSDESQIRRALRATVLHIYYYRSKTKQIGYWKEILETVYSHRLYSKKTDLEKLAADFEFEISVSKKLEDQELLDRISRSSPKPQEYIVVTTAFKRNADVKALVLRYANNNCEYCGSKGPFNREDGSIYLETHHIIPLSEGGDDSIENSIAMCPNCHREAHFGREAINFRNIAKQKISKSRPKITYSEE